MGSNPYSKTIIINCYCYINNGCAHRISTATVKSSKFLYYSFMTEEIAIIRIPIKIIWFMKTNNDCITHNVNLVINSGDLQIKISIMGGKIRA